MNKLLIFLLSLCVTSLEAATITNWGAQLPTMVPASGDAILMQKGGVTYYFTPVQLATFISTNLSLGTSNAIPNLNGSGTNATFAATIGVATNLWQLLGTNGLPLVFVTSNQVMTVSNTLVLSARPQSTTTVPLTLIGSQGQDANLLNVKDYLGNVLFAISYDGTFSDPRLASPSSAGALWTATDDIGNGAWSTNLTPQNLSISNVIALKALVLNANKQVTNAATSSADLDNFFAMGITNVLASTGIAIGTNGGALTITNTGATTVSNAVIANLNGKGTNTSFYGIVTGETVRATNVLDPSNVKYWGAVEGTAIDNALTNALARHKNVYIPAGQYYLNSSITVPDSTRIYGDGPDASKLMNCGATNLTMFVMGQKTALSGLLIDGFCGAGVTDGGVRIASFETKIIDCWFQNLATNIVILTGYAEIRSCRFSTVFTNKHAIVISGPTGGSGNRITDNRFEVGDGSGILYAWASNGDLVSGNIFEGGNGSGCKGITIPTNASMGVVNIIGNYWEDIAIPLSVGVGGGAKPEGSLNLMGNEFAASAGVFITSISNLVAIGNRFRLGWGVGTVDNLVNVQNMAPAFTNGAIRYANISDGSITLSDKLGVGGAPVNKLDVTGAASVSSGMIIGGTTVPGIGHLTLGSMGDFGTLNIHQSGDSYTTVTIGDSVDTSKYKGLYFRSYGVNGISTSGGDLAFFTTSAGSGEKLRLLAGGNFGINTAAPLDKLHVVGGIVQTNGGIWQTWSLGAPSAPATQGAVYWNDGTNICAVFRNAAGALSTNKLSMSAWP